MDPEPGSLTYAKQAFNFSRCLGSLICKMQTRYSFRIPPGVVGRFTSGDVKPHNMPATLTNVRRANPTLGPHRDTDWVLFLPFRRWQAWGADTAQYLSGDCGTQRAWEWSRKTWGRGSWKVDHEDGLGINHARWDEGTPYTEWQAGRRGCLSDYPRLLSPMPSLLFLDHVKMKDKPGGKVPYIKLERLVLPFFLTSIYLVF